MNQAPKDPLDPARSAPPQAARTTLRGGAAALISDVGRRIESLMARHDWPLISALTLAVAASVETLIYTGGPTTSDGSTALLLNLMATLPLALRPKHLAVATAIVTSATFLAIAGSATLTASAVLGQMTVLYLAAARYQRLTSVLLAVPFLVIALSGSSSAVSGLALLVLAVAALVIGDSRGMRSEAIAERDASRRAMAEAQREQVLMEERARIARELHDIVAHHVSMIAVQAENARLTTAALPPEGQERLDAIARTARDALSELRRLLGVLREDARGAADRAPQPTLAHLDELIDTARATGMPVNFTLRGPVGPLPPGVDLAAYRIVQEALTNARRHAPGAEVEVNLSYTPEAIHLLIRDQGPGPAEDHTGGQGLIGMEERVAMLGGKLRTGRADGGGFVVEADLPAVN